MMLRTLACFLIFTCGCTSQRAQSSKVTIQTKKGEIRFDVEVVKDNASRMRGLMDRDSLASGSGMLFIFDEDSDHSFWMKNTRIPLDIVFFDASWKVVGALEDMQPQSLLGRTIGVPSRYALEINAGLVAKNGIAAGDRATFVEKK